MNPSRDEPEAGEKSGMKSPALADASGIPLPVPRRAIAGGRELFSETDGPGSLRIGRLRPFAELLYVLAPTRGRRHRGILSRDPGASDRFRSAGSVPAEGDDHA